MSIKDFQSPMPQVGMVYEADDYNWLGNTFDIGPKSYKFIKSAGGQYIRTNESVSVNANSNIAVASLYEFTDGLSTADVNGYSIATTVYYYYLIAIGGISPVLTNEGTIGADMTNMPLVNDYVTGVVGGITRRTGTVVNALAAQTIAGGTCNLNANATAAIVYSATGTFSVDLRPGDTVIGNAAGVASKIINIASNTVAYGIHAVANTASASLTVVRGPQVLNSLTLTGVDTVQWQTQKIQEFVVNVKASDANVWCINANSVYAFRVGDRVNVVNTNGTAEVHYVTSVNATAGLVNTNADWSTIAVTAADKNLKCYISGRAVKALVEAY
jgi:hypothetical protein